MRQDSDTSTRREPRIGRLSRTWLMAAVITGAVAVLAPGVHYAMAGPSVSVSHPQAATLAAQTGEQAQANAGQTPTPQAGVAAQAAGPGCLGVTPAVFPAQGFITNPNRSQGGHLWWRFAGDGTSVCIGTVVEFVQYNATATKTWRVIVYTRQNPGGVTVAKRTFTLNRGDYFWGFGVHRVFSGLTAVCLAADESFGMSCVHFS
ncbi:MAG TPA: hypothetical protein VGI96_13910 [Streptosporangiaceae bacterium]